MKKCLLLFLEYWKVNRLLNYRFKLTETKINEQSLSLIANWAILILHILTRLHVLRYSVCCMVFISLDLVIEQSSWSSSVTLAREKPVCYIYTFFFLSLLSENSEPSSYTNSDNKYIQKSIVCDLSAKNRP